MSAWIKGGVLMLSILGHLSTDVGRNLSQSPVKKGSSNNALFRNDVFIPGLSKWTVLKCFIGKGLLLFCVMARARAGLVRGVDWSDSKSRPKVMGFSILTIFVSDSF